MFYSAENQVGVTDVKMLDQEPADQSLIDLWEKVFANKIITFKSKFFNMDYSSGLGGCTLKQ